MGQGGSATPAGPGQTPDERRAAIDKRLDDSLGTFDAQLRKEQQAVAQERDAHQTGSAGGATTVADTADASGTNKPPGEKSDKQGDPSGSANTEAPSGDERGKGQRSDADKRGSRPGDLKSDKSRKSDDNAGNGASAKEIPDGSNDDVVARRLRKAAEQETDPELKEKLWKEYIEYKKNAQGA